MPFLKQLQIISTWINIGYVGYSRVSKGGSVNFSDADNVIVRRLQKLHGISTKEKTHQCMVLSEL